MSDEKKKAWEKLCETQPHKAYLQDREGFVRHMQHSRRKLYGNRPGFQEMTRKQIEESLDKTK